MVSRKTIAAVSYLNTIPFIYGIAHSGNNLCADLLLSPPSSCSALFLDQKCDVALVPVASVRAMSNIRVLERFCIGASGHVRSVALLSNSPLESITKIYLDNHSQTSVLLARILAENFWKIAPQWVDIEDSSAIDPSEENAAWVLIGDKVFDFEDKFDYNYDLAQQWTQHTGLPFVFAVWVAREDLEEDYTSRLEAALEYGINNIERAIAGSEYASRDYARHYLTHNIDYVFDHQKKKAMRLFWDLGMKIKPPINPG